MGRLLGSGSLAPLQQVLGATGGATPIADQCPAGQVSCGDECCPSGGCDPSSTCSIPLSSRRLGGGGVPGGVALVPMDYPYDPGYGPTLDHCQLYGSALSRRWLTRNLRHNLGCACLNTPNNPLNNCVRKCLQARLTAYLNSQSGPGPGICIDWPADVCLEPRCDTIYSHHAECYKECGCGAPFIQKPFFTTMCGVYVPCNLVGLSIEYSNACRCPAVSCSGGRVLSRTTCQCECPAVRCPTGQVQDPFSCSCVGTCPGVTCSGGQSLNLTT